MEAIQEVYEKIPHFVEVPAALHDQHVTVIWQPVTQTDSALDLPELREWTVEEIAAELKMKPEDIRDPEAMKFFGCLPDFPPRAPQDEYEERAGLDLA